MRLKSKFKIAGKCWSNARSLASDSSLTAMRSLSSDSGVCAAHHAADAANNAPMCTSPVCIVDANRRRTCTHSLRSSQYGMCVRTFDCKYFGNNSRTATRLISEPVGVVALAMFPANVSACVHKLITECPSNSSSPGPEPNSPVDALCAPKMLSTK